MRRARSRAIVLTAAFAIYAILAFLILLASRRHPWVPHERTIEIVGMAMTGTVGLMWGILLFREMDSFWEQLLIFSGIGFVFCGAVGGGLDEIYEVGLPLTLLESIALPIGLVLVTGGLAIRMIRARTYANRLRMERDANEDLALRDPLTHLYNRRYLRRILEDLLANADKRGETICLGFIDADNFKDINDQLGHDTGDAFLVGLGRAISAAIRETDIAVRFGGDEFVVVLVGSGVDEAVRIADRIQGTVRKLGRPYRGSDGTGPNPSISIGVAAHHPGETGLQLIARADEAMYAAKRDGKARTAVA